MEYKSLSNVEIMLLQIIAEKQQVSGYEINRLIQSRGYKEWANIGQTSVYVGLKKLKDKKLIIPCVEKKKGGKGPTPTNFKMSETGMKILKQEIVRLLSNSKDRDREFDLGVAGIPICPIKQVLSALNQRKEFIKDYSKGIKDKFNQQGGEKLPVHVKSLFAHSLFLIEKELEFLDRLIINLRKEKL